MSKKIRIAITDCGKFENYRRWIESSGVDVIKLSRLIDNAEEISNCDGILFSGGEDLHPELYGRPEYVQAFGLNEIIPERDLFEYQVLEKALGLKKPILGICRGLQLINVYLGGTLVPDIPLLFRSGSHGKINGEDQYHQIEVEPETLLEQICGNVTGKVNSAHHQSADRPADDLRISAYSEPDIIEGLEWKNPENKSWLLMVQWHPERMKNPEDPFSSEIKKAFLNSCSTS